VLLLVIAAASDFLWQRWLRETFAPIDSAYRYIPSPNLNDRPFGAVVDCIVLHSTAGSTLQSAVDIFEDPASRVSAHFVVGKDGTVVLMAPLEKRAWHAGASMLDGESNVNDFSVGIEIVNENDGVDPYTPAQYAAVAGIIRRIRTRCDIPDDRIVSHAAIALPRGRKSDPKGFDWARLRRLLHGRQGNRMRT
jgi:N-acetylmuramoyl-L-alanine amidase/AmpD protein